MTHTKRMEIRAHREPWVCDTIAVRIALITNQDGIQSIALAESLVLRTLTENDLSLVQPETMRLRPDEAQFFMDELWRVGIRPTEGAGSVGQLAATERHLEDLRKLVFKEVKS